jgi:hypothetical protein
MLKIFRFTYRPVVLKGIVLCVELGNACTVPTWISKGKPY